MLAYFIILIKLLSVGLLNTVMTYIAINGSAYSNLIDAVYFALNPTSWFLCMAWAYDERYTLAVTVALMFILLLWLILGISMLIGLLSKKTRVFAIKMSCIVLLIDVVSSLFVVEPSWEIACILINFVFFVCTLISLKRAKKRLL